MSKPTLVSISDYPDAFTAETIRIRLAAAGIQAFLTGTDAATALGMGGAGTNRLIRLEVAPADHALAVEILRADEAQLAAASRWTCSRCGEANEPAFDICWSCNKERTSADRGERPENDGDGDKFSPSETDAGFSVPASDSVARREDSNPYRPFGVSSDVDSPTARKWPTPSVSDEVRDDVRRALTASIVGMLILPPLVNLYSLLLTLRIPKHAYADGSQRFRLIITWIINLVTIPAWALFWIAPYWR